MDAQQLEDKLTCAICLALYRDPLTLPCGHNFCGACIQDWWGRRERACPECREPVPAGARPGRNVALSGVLELLRAGPRPGPPPAPPARQLERRQRQDQLRARLEAAQQQTTQAQAQLQELQQQRNQIQSSACTLTSVVSGKFSRLQQALELRRASALRHIEAAKEEALAQAGDQEQQLQRHLEALAQYGHRVQHLEQADDQTFFQESQQLLEPPEPLGPLTPPQWDEDQQLGDLEELLSALCGLLLEDKAAPREPAEAPDPRPVEAPSPLALVPSTVSPLRRKLWQNYRNLTFDPDSANRHFYLSRQDQRVTHRPRPRAPAGPASFELWQVLCTQSFRAGRHYWEVRASDHSVTLGVTYPELARHKLGTLTDNIGRGPSSWGLCVQEDCVQAWHNGEVQRLPKESGRLLGVNLDLETNCVTFYSLEPQAKPLHTFHALFTRPLYPVFWLLEGRTLTLCQRPEATLPPGPQEEASALS